MALRRALHVVLRDGRMSQPERLLEAVKIYHLRKPEQGRRVSVKAVCPVDIKHEGGGGHVMAVVCRCRGLVLLPGVGWCHASTPMTSDECSSVTQIGRSASGKPAAEEGHSVA